MEIASFYIRSSYPHVSEVKLRTLALQFQEAVSAEAQGLFGGYGFELVGDLEEGTLRAKARLSARLLAVYGAIAIYPDFEDGVVRLYERAMQFTEFVERQFMEITEVRPDDVLAERKTFRDLDRLQTAIAALNAARNTRNMNERTELVEAAVEALAPMLRPTLTDKEFEELLRALRADKIPEFPKSRDEFLLIEERKRKLSIEERVPHRFSEALEGALSRRAKPKFRHHWRMQL